MGTESIQSKSKTLHRIYQSYGVFLNALNGEGANTLYQGQAVYISANNSVKAKTLGSQFAIGVVNVGNAVGEELSVRANILCDSLAKAIGANQAAGTLVRYNGNRNSTTGIPEVVVAADGEYADAIVFKGGNANDEIRILVLQSQVKISTGS